MARAHPKSTLLVSVTLLHDVSTDKASEFHQMLERDPRLYSIVRSRIESAIDDQVRLGEHAGISADAAMAILAAIGLQHCREAAEAVVL